MTTTEMRVVLEAVTKALELAAKDIDDETSLLADMTPERAGGRREATQFLRSRAAEARHRVAAIEGKN